MMFMSDVARTAVRGLAAVALGLAAASPVAAQQAVILVRHAERADQSTDSPLSAAGTERAKALARILASSGVTKIFVTQFQRTQLTAAPLAAALELTPLVVQATTPTPLVERLRRDHANDVVLVVGHSNTVPALLKEFGHAAPVTMADDEFDSLYVLVPRGTGPPSVLRLRY
jgi:broad specificity phosphatase PhoE